MSVVASKRQESSMEFINNARKLETFTIRKVAHFPKRYMFLMSTNIAQIAQDIYDSVIMANNFRNIYDHGDFSLRLHYFKEASSKCHDLAAQIELANDVFPIQMETMEEWMGYIDLEIRLIAGIMRKDRELLRLRAVS